MTDEHAASASACSPATSTSPTIPTSRARAARGRAATAAYNASPPDDGERAGGILAELLGAFGEGSEIRPPFYCDYGYQTHIGARDVPQLRRRRARRRAHHDRRRRPDRAATCSS